MHTIEVPGRKQVFEMPSDWNELDRKTVMRIIKLSMQLSGGVINQDKMIIASFYAIANVNRNWISVLKERLLSKQQRTLKYANVYQLAKELTSFLFVPEDPDKPDQRTELNFDCIVNFIPELKVKRGLSYFGPKDLLSDLTFGEFHEALANMNAYFLSKDDQDLDYFISALYRPQQIEGVRQPLDEYYKSHAGALKKLPAHLKYCILLWFTACIKYIKTGDLIINGQEINLSVLFPAGGSGGKRSAGLGWTGLLFGIAKEGLFGDIEKTNKAKLFDVLLFMYDNYYKQLRLNSKK